METPRKFITAVINLRGVSTNKTKKYLTDIKQPRTQAQITKNRHTKKNEYATVFLYRSVAKMSERAGVLGEDAGNEASRSGCVLPKHPRALAQPIFSYLRLGTRLDIEQHPKSLNFCTKVTHCRCCGNNDVSRWQIF